MSRRQGLIFLLTLTIVFVIATIVAANNKRRVKRYITFPEGSTFSFAFCMEIKAVTPDDPDIFTEAVAVATSYDLPNNSMTLGITSDKHHVLARSQRSYIYSRISLVLDRIGLAGQECLLRALCEGAQQLQPKRDVLSEIIRIILKFPELATSSDEPVGQWLYLKAYKAGLADLNCPDLYPGCSVSLVGLALSLRPQR